MNNIIIFLVWSLHISAWAQTITASGNVTVNIAAEFNVRVFGAKGDGRAVNDAVLTGNSTTITSATADFLQSDVGKDVWGLIPAGTLVLAKTTIATVVDGNTITVASAPPSSFGSVTLTFGTDDTDAIQAAAAAADSVSPKGRVVVPRGGYAFTDLLFDQSYAQGQLSYSVIGEGSNCTTFFAAPGHALTGGYVFSRVSNVNGGAFRGFTIQGGHITYAAGGGLIVMHAGSTMIYEDVTVTSFKNGSGNMVLVSCPGSYTRFINCRFEFSSHVGIACMGFRPSFIECYNGNHGSTGVDLYAGKMLWQGGVLDECGGGTVYMQAGAELNVIQALIYAGYGKTAVRVVGGVFRATQSEIRPWWVVGHNNSTALKVDAGSAAELSQTTLTGSGAGFGLDNAGVVEDGGNNHTNTKTGGGTITSPSL